MDWNCSRMKTRYPDELGCFSCRAAGYCPSASIIPPLCVRVGHARMQDPRYVHTTRHLRTWEQQFLGKNPGPWLTSGNVVDRACHISTGGCSLPDNFPSTDICLQSRLPQPIKMTQNVLGSDPVNLHHAPQRNPDSRAYERNTTETQSRLSFDLILH